MAQRRGVGSGESTMTDDDNKVFEILLHTMEICLVVGIGLVVWWLKRKERKNGKANESGSHSE